MRWPFTTRRSRVEPPTEPFPVVVLPRATPRHWRRLAALSPTAGAHPLTLDPRQLGVSHDLLARNTSPAPVPGPSGHVTGLAAAPMVGPVSATPPTWSVPRSSTGATSSGPARQAMSAPAQVRERHEERPQLLQATDEWVGAAREPATPFRSVTDFDRLVAHFEGMDIAEAVGLSGIQGAAGGFTEQAPQPPPPPARPPGTRKRTLGESRRHGLLGRPATRTAEEPEPSAQDEPTDDEPASWTLQDGFTTGDAGTTEPGTTEPGDPVVPPTQPPPPEHGELDTRLTALDRAVAELRDRAAPPDLENSHDLDELARRLYPYLRSRLRAELIVDRERAGRLADAR